MRNVVAVVPEEASIFSSSLSPSPSQKRLAVVVVLVILVVALFVTGPLSSINLAPVPAFVSGYTIAMFVNDSLTATLLFGQFYILRSPALLVIASGYVFTALILIPWLLAFPGVFAPTALIGGLQSTSWLFFFGHVGFPMFVIGYALSKDEDPSKRFRLGVVPAAIVVSVALTTAVALAVVFLCIAGEPLLPRVIIDPIHFSPLQAPLFGTPIALLAISAVSLLWVRRHSILDLWLMVVMCLLLIQIPLNYYPVAARFSIGWYTIRVIEFLASGLVLVVLLHEITTLYARLLRSIHAQRSEREARLMTGDTVSASIAHEIRQPLGAIITSAKAGLNWLDRVEPDLDRAKEAFRRVESAGQRADAVIENIRAHFQMAVRTHASLDIEDVILEALAVVRDKLQTHRVVVQAYSNERLPRIRGEQVQLQQVMMNLITNAIDSMARENGERVLSIKSEVHHSKYVMVSVEDTGKGLEPNTVDRIFNPMFTTKTHGMGMGLSICRSIIEAHGGQIWVTADKGRGVIFHFTVPVDPGSPSLAAA